MNKTKLALSVLSIMLFVVPVVCMVYVYRDNLLGLVMPPQLSGMLSGEGDPISSFTASDFTMPTMSEPQYNAQTGSFNVGLNVTNPLATTVSVHEFSAQIKSKGTNELLGTISLSKPISIGPGENALIDVVGNLDTATVNQLKANSGDLNIILQNVDANVGGVRMHLDQLDLGSMQLPG